MMRLSESLMESSGDHVSFMDQSTSSTHLVVKANHNLIMDADESKYLTIVKLMIVCLKNSFMRKALTSYS